MQVCETCKYVGEIGNNWVCWVEQGEPEFTEQRRVACGKYKPWSEDCTTCAFTICNEKGIDICYHGFYVWQLSESFLESIEKEREVTDSEVVCSFWKESVL